MYVKSNEPGKTWNCTVIRTHRGIFAVAQEGAHETGVGPCNLETFSFEMFGDRRAEIKLDAKRLTAKVEREGLAAIAAKVAGIGPIAPPAPAEPLAVGFKLVTKEPDQQFQVREFADKAEFLAAMEAAGRKPVGEQQQRPGGIKLREELPGQPTFADLIGPMYDGPGKVRYENQEANDRLSA
jgi:hypothetical protein